MRKRRRRRKGIFFLSFLVAMGLVLWYLQLDESRKRFIQNIVRQLPYLPGRYSV